MQKKIFSLLVLLMTAVSGAWADETPLVTIESKDYTSFKSGSMTFDDKVTVTFSNTVKNYGDEWGWYSDFTASLLTVAGINGYTITSCKFYAGDGTADYTVEGESPSVYLTGSKVYTDDSKSVNIGSHGVTKIEVYGYAGTPAPDGPAVTPTENKNEWTFTMPDYAVVAKVEYETELELQEEKVNTTVLADWDGYEADVTLKRTLVAGSWNTLAVPFNVSSAALTALNGLLAAQGGSLTVKKFANTTLSGETISLNFENATEIEAGKPYLVKVTKDVNLASLSAAIDAAIALGQFSANPFKDAVISKDPVPVKTQYVDFIPTLGKTLVTGPEGDEDNKDAVLFVAAYNTLKNPTVVNDPEQESSYLKGFRAYFQLKNVPAAARAFALNIDGETTGIKAIDNGQLTIDNDRYYDLQGRKVNAAQKGVYIMNGKKVIK